MKDVSTGVEVIENGDTVYLTSADSEGNMLSLLQSNFREMGTGFVVLGLGISFRNRGELFSIDSKLPNAYASGKHSFHTIILGFVMKYGQPFLAMETCEGLTSP